MAEKSVDESKVMLRMCDLTSEPKRMLPPIKGYEKEPIVSLEQAVKPLLSLVPDIEEMVWTVKQNCQHPPDHLSSDESAAIMLYTLEWMPSENSFYFILNKTLRSQNRQELLPWFPFLRLFIIALSKLPSTEHKILYRGIKMDLSDEFPVGKIFIWWAFSSCTSSIEVLEQFLGQSGHRTIFNIEYQSAEDISQHSFYESEKEILMYPARQFQVVSSFNSGNQLRIIHIKEIQPPFPLIHIPETCSTKIYQNKQLQHLIEHCQPHSEVDLREQNLNDEDMEIVVKEAIINKQCKTLNLRFNEITSDGVSVIAKVLNNNTALKRLFLSGNHLCDTGVQCLRTTLSVNNSKLKSLGLQNTGITDVEVEHIAEMLKTNTTLKYLLLADNEISDRGVVLLANALTDHNKTLTYLHLNENKLVSDSSIACLVNLLKHNQTLQYLCIVSCDLSAKGKEKVRETAKSKEDFTIDL